MRRRIIFCIVLVLLCGCNKDSEIIDLSKLDTNQKELYKEFYRDDNYFSGEYFDVRYTVLSRELKNIYDFPMKDTEYQTSSWTNNLKIFGDVDGLRGAIIGLTIVPKTEEEFKKIRFHIYKKTNSVGISPIDFIPYDKYPGHVDYKSAGPYYAYFAVLEGDYSMDTILISYNRYRNFSLGEIEELRTLTLKVEIFKGDDFENIDIINIEYTDEIQ